MTSEEEYLRKLQPWIEAIETKIGEVNFKNLARFEQEVTSEALKRLIQEITGLEIDRLTVSDVYEVFYALKTNVEEPYISFSFWKNSKGIFKIP